MKLTATVILSIIGLAVLGEFIASNVSHFKGASGNSLNTDLISYWKLDETSGTRVDSEPTGTAQNLQDNNTVGYTNGVIGNAAYFIGANNEYFSRTSATDIEGGPRDFSLSFWVNLQGGSQIGLFNHGLTRVAPNYDYFVLYDTGLIRFRVIKDSDGGVLATQASMQTNAWVFVSCIYSNSGIATYLYTNGVLAATNTVPGGSRDSSTDDINVGRSLSADLYMTGYLDEIGFWNKVLSQSEITDLYNSGAGKTCCPFE